MALTERQKERDKSFKVGDTVAIRNVEAMQEEFRTSASGSIECRKAFVKEMREYCGTEHTIIQTNQNEAGYITLSPGIPGYSISTDMIKKIRGTTFENLMTE